MFIVSEPRRIRDGRLAWGKLSRGCSYSPSKHMKTNWIQTWAFKLIAVAGVAFCVSVAQAHTVSIGVYNAGAPGSVTLAMGTYSHGTPIFQGTMTLIAGPGIPPNIAQPFASVTTTKPAGLIDGVNNFYADATPAQWGTLPADSFTSASYAHNLGSLGPVVNWQELTFTGLTTGLYTYQLSGMTSQNWENLNSFQNNWTGTFFVSGATAGNVPDGGLTALMLGASLVGFAAVRRRMVRG
jgi:hypothetical protein